MPDPVNAAEVPRNAVDALRKVIAEDFFFAEVVAEEQADALLAYGDGDPVVIMPDGKLRRLRRQSKFGQLMLCDPVVPE